HGRQGLGQGEGARVEGLADDGALHADVGERGDRAQVVEAGHPAGGHHRLVGVIAHLPQQVEVRAGQGAVLRDVGDDVAGAAVGVEPLERLEQVPALLDPATRGQGAPPYVEPDRDAVAVAGDRGAAPVGVLDGGGADVDAAAAGREGGLEGLVVADAPGQLDVDV